MAFYPTSTTGLVNAGLPAGPTVNTVTVTGNASANTKGSYTTIVASASTTSNAAAISCLFGTNNIDGLTQLLDIATGAAASEVVVLPNLATDMAGTGFSTAWCANFCGTLPWKVTSGTRISGRVQGNSGSRTIAPYVQLVTAGGWTGIDSYVNYGADTSTSGQTGLDPGGTVNTKGSYTEVTASTSAVTQSLLVMFTWNGDRTSGTGGKYCVDVSTGAAASEVVLLADLRCFKNNAFVEDCTFNGRMQEYLTYIPASTRIAARCSCSSNTATGRLMEIGLLAGTAPASNTFYPQSASGLSVVTYPVGPTANGTALTSGAANTKGAYAEISASVSATTNRVTINMTNAADTDAAQLLMDFATGAAGAEVVRVPNIGVDGQGGDTGFGYTWLPWKIPSGSRVSARVQSDFASQQPRVAVTACATGSMPGITTFTDYGVDLTDSGGTLVDPGGTANTKGSYVQITASTSALMQWALLNVTNNGVISLGSPGWCVDLATGAGGAETVVWSDVRMIERDASFEAQNYSGRWQNYATYIPASTRLAVRASCSINDVNIRKIDVSIIGGFPTGNIGPWIYYEQQHNQSGGF